MTAAPRLALSAWFGLAGAAAAGAAAFLLVVALPSGPLPPPTGERIVVPWHTSTRLTVAALSWPTPDTADIVTRRDGKTGTTFTHRLIDCRSREFMLLGEGRSEAEVLAVEPGERSRVPIAENTIPFYVAAWACQADRPRR